MYLNGNKFNEYKINKDTIILTDELHHYITNIDKDKH